MVASLTVSPSIVSGSIARSCASAAGAASSSKSAATR
jgi:hypothetical protein